MTKAFAFRWPFNASEQNAFLRRHSFGDVLLPGKLSPYPNVNGQENLRNVAYGRAEVNEAWW